MVFWDSGRVASGSMVLFDILLIVSALLCALVAGLLLIFSAVVMPGIGTLDDRGYLEAFQVIDRPIQNNQPIFMLVWVGSVLSTIAAAVLAFSAAEETQRTLVLVAVAIYLFGVQLPTATINIPLNNALQAHDLDAMDAVSLASARSAFESRWNRWNGVRSALAVLTALLLITAVGST